MLNAVLFNTLKQLKHHKVPLLVIVALWFIYWWQIICGESQFYIRDLTFYTLPYKTFMMTQFLAGKLPFWTPMISTGMPFIAEPSHQVFYPLNLIFFFTSGVIQGISWFILLHLLFAPIAFYTLCRTLRMTKTSALFAALIYGYGGYVISISDNLNYLPAVVWIPLALSFFINGLKKNSLAKSLPFMALTAVCIAVLILAGDVFNPMILGFACVVLGLLYPSKSLPLKGTCLYTLSCFALAGLIAGIQILPTLELMKWSVRQDALSYTETTLWSFPPQRLIELIVPYFYGSKYNTFNYQGPHFLGMFLYPQFREPWVDSIYIGVISGFFATLASLFRFKKSRPWLLIILISVLVSMGSYLSFYPVLINLLPIIKIHRYLEKGLFFVNIGFAVLAGFGASYALTHIQSATTQIKACCTQNKTILGLCIFTLLLLIANQPNLLQFQFSVTLNSMPDFDPYLRFFYFTQNSFIVLFGTWLALAILEKQNRFKVDALIQSAIITGLILLSGIIIFIHLPSIMWIWSHTMEKSADWGTHFYMRGFHVSGLFLHWLVFSVLILSLFWMHAKNQKEWTKLLMVAGVLNLMLIHGNHVPVAKTTLLTQATPQSKTALQRSSQTPFIRLFYDDQTEPSENKNVPDLLYLINQHSDAPVNESFYNYWTYRVLYYRQRLLFNSGILYDIPYQNGRFSPLQPKNHKQMDTVLSQYDPLLWLKLSGVTHIATRVNLEQTHWKDYPNQLTSVFQAPEYDMNILKLNQHLKRASLIDTIIFNPNPVKTFKATEKNYPQQHPEQVIELHSTQQKYKQALASLSSNITPTQKNTNHITVLKDEAGTLEIETSTTKETILLVNESYFPGWQATDKLTRTPLTVMMANQRMIAIPLKPGHYQIELKYHSRYFMLGCILSLLGVVLTALLLFKPFQSQNRSQPPV